MVIIDAQAPGDVVTCGFCGVKNSVPNDALELTLAEYAAHLGGEGPQSEEGMLPEEDDAPLVSPDLIAALEAFAWVILAGGIIGAAFIWAEYATFEDSNGLLTEFKTLGAVSGAVFLLNGLFWFLIAKVVARTAAGVNVLGEGARAN